MDGTAAATDATAQIKALSQEGMARYRAGAHGEKLSEKSFVFGHPR